MGLTLYGGLLMDYRHMTAPCGLDCFNCYFYLATQGDPEALKITKSFNDTIDRKSVV